MKVNSHRNYTLASGFDNKGRLVFEEHDHLYGYEEIVTGAPVRTNGGRTHKRAAVGRNTIRGFHRLNKAKAGALMTFQSVFLDQKKRICDAMHKVRSEEDLHVVANRISAHVRRKLTNIRPDQLLSFNKVRKPVDLYIENLVTMSKELKGIRRRLVPWLFLPLDSQMMNSPYVFSEPDLTSVGLYRGATYKDVLSETMYLRLQDIARVNARRIAKTSGRFFRIYYDLLWNERWKRSGSNLLELNP